ncbi:FtsX-like permease family protein [Sporolactobacillus inulinus]|uniref:ABC transporter permease n=1 Tax=Sporolactobacillus inulinus CASD TaxID=1069536 RepID=A0A0U1QR97_9BACL|nr:ABC transporter permease [Sporolactobacillus inulinus]KLI03344.1 ABC transporter permease [Sporolactobacillus inulinus CASD]GEB78004.1 ABC transporter permease [Sporolactobacillus inulinus]
MFYVKLAGRNIRQSMSNFLPFALSSVVMFLMNLMLATILLSPSLKKLQGWGNFALLLSLGLIVLTIFATIFMIYSYRFLLKRRTKEFGLYNILGLKKRQIVRISILELLMMFLVTVVSGTILGIILAKFLYLILINLVGENYFDLQWSPLAVGIVTVLFACIYLLLMIISSFSIRRQSSLELLKNASKGEKEPKSRGILALLGLVSLAIGYYLAVTVASPLDALTKFFIAVLFVIFGTLLFYMSFTIWLLKRQKKNKGYYYQPKHFITVSSMLYRMKQNAVGLANITILVTMTFVTLATTVGLFSSINGFLNDYFVRNTIINVNTTQQRSTELVDQVAEKNGIKVSNPVVYELSNSIVGAMNNGKFENKQNLAKLTTVNFMTAETYTALTGNPVHLRGNEAIAYPAVGSFNEDQVMFGNHTFKIKQTIIGIHNFPSTSRMASNWLILIVNTKETIQPVLDDATKAAGNHYPLGFDTTISADLTGNDAKKLQTTLSDYRVNGDAPIRRTNDSKTKIEQDDRGEEKTLAGMPPTVDRYDDMHQQLISFAGGFLFIGLVLGFTFILGTALIIYYKQISEGEQDKRSFEILQEVGLSGEEVRQTIRSQVLLVFFMPIAVAIVHFGFAFIMIQKLISLFGATRFGLLLLTSIGTIAVVAAIYYIIYKQTSRAYYRIVER